MNHRWLGRCDRPYFVRPAIAVRRKPQLYSTNSFLPQGLVLITFNGCVDIAIKMFLMEEIIRNDT
jgi:hypothetical protein